MNAANETQIELLPTPGLLTPQPQLQAISLSLGHRVLAPPAADPLDAGGDPAG